MKQAVTETGELVWQKDEDGNLKPQMKRNSYGGADWVEIQKAVLQEMMLKEFGWERFYKGSNPRGNLHAHRCGLSDHPACVQYVAQGRTIKRNAPRV